METGDAVHWPAPYAGSFGLGISQKCRAQQTHGQSQKILAVLQMREIERVLASFGIFGKPLSEVEDATAQKAMASGVAEIVPVVDMEELDRSWSLKPSPNVFAGPVSDITNKAGYILRLKTAEWRRIVLENRFKDSKFAFLVSSVLVRHGEDGITRDALKAESKASAKTFSSILRRLLEYNIATAETVDGRTLYRYSFKHTDDAGRPPPNEEKKPRTNKKTEGNKSRQPEMDSTKEHERISPKLTPDKATLSKEISEDTRNLFRDIMMSSEDPILVADLEKQLAISEVSLKNLIKYTKDKYKFRICEDGNRNSFIIPAAVSGDKLNRLVSDYITVNRAMVLSDHMTNLKKIDPATFSQGKQKLMDVFEQQGFSVVEISSKYSPTEFIVYESGLSKDSLEFVEAYERTKQKIGRSFKDKIKRHFYRNAAYYMFDNGYQPSAKARAMLLYRHILGQMRENGGNFTLDEQAIMRMSFETFSACVQLSQENLLPLLAAFVVNKFGLNGPAEQELVNRWAEVCPTDAVFTTDFTAVNMLKAVEGAGIDDEREEYILFYSSSENVLKDIAVGSVIEAAEAYKSDIAAYLRDRCAVREFFSLLLLFDEYLIFRKSESGDFLFFEIQQEVEDGAKQIIDKINEKAFDIPAIPLTAETRLGIFQRIIDFNSTEFVHKTRDLIRSTPLEPSTRNFLLKKLNNFR